jgi:protein-arginine kinase activator protein McsA
MAEHSGILYDEVLQAVEESINSDMNFAKIPVVILQSESGTTLFMLKSYEATIESLEKSLEWFVKEEEYEKAARVRDAKEIVVSSFNPFDKEEETFGFF